jgi:hypothetical protein
VDQSTREIRAQIEQTQAELGDTVEALIKKAKIKDQAKASAKNAMRNLGPKLSTKAGEPPPTGADADAVRQARNRVPAGVFAVAAGLAVVLMLRKRLSK